LYYIIIKGKKMKKEPYAAPVMEIVLLEREKTVLTSGCEDGDEAGGTGDSPVCETDCFRYDCPGDVICPTHVACGSYYCPGYCGEW
jgi:hypothetical protein